MTKSSSTFAADIKRVIAYLVGAAILAGAGGIITNKIEISSVRTLVVTRFDAMEKKLDAIDSFLRERR